MTLWRTAMRRFALIILLACLSTPAFAVYKCEVDGKTVYQDNPCSTGGREAGIAAHPAKNPDARRQLAQDKAKVNRLERERHRKEAQDAREQRQAARSAAARKKKCDNLALRKKWADEDAARASWRNRERAQIKSRRATERLAQECS